MYRIIVVIILALLLVSCGSKELKTEVDQSLAEVENQSKFEVQDSLIITTDPANLEVEIIQETDINEEIIFIEATVLSIGEELIMPSDYLTTSMHVLTDNGDTLVFLDISEDEVKEGEKISLYYKLEKGEDAIVCFNCESYLGNVDLIDVTGIAGKVRFESFKLSNCIPDDYLVLNAVFTMFDKSGLQSDFKTLDYRMIDDTAKMFEGYYSYGIVSQYYPVLETFEQIRD